MVSGPVELKLRLHTTHPPDFWYSNRYSQHLFPCQQSGGWAMCRRSSGSLTAHSRLFEIGGFYTHEAKYKTKIKALTVENGRRKKSEAAKPGNERRRSKMHNGTVHSSQRDSSKNSAPYAAQCC